MRIEDEGGRGKDGQMIWRPGPHSGGVFMVGQGQATTEIIGTRGDLWPSAM